MSLRNGASSSARRARKSEPGPAEQGAGSARRGTAPLAAGVRTTDPASGRYTGLSGGIRREKPSHLPAPRLRGLRQPIRPPDGPSMYPMTCEPASGAVKQASARRAWSHQPPLGVVRRVRSCWRRGVSAKGPSQRLAYLSSVRSSSAEEGIPLFRGITGRAERSGVVPAPTRGWAVAAALEDRNAEYEFSPHFGPQQLQQVRESLAGLRPGGRTERGSQRGTCRVDGEREMIAGSGHHGWLPGRAAEVAPAIVMGTAMRRRPQPLGRRGACMSPPVRRALPRPARGGSPT
jgi:hypothetical protein